jgi:hypothetical protein
MSTAEELAKAYSGLLGEQIVVKKGGKGKNVVVLAKSWVKREPTEKQLAQRERLSLAAAYARIAMQDPELKEMYAKRAKKGVSVFRTAANDYMQRPFIRDVDVSEYLGNPLAGDPDFAISHGKAVGYDSPAFSGGKIDLVSEGAIKNQKLRNYIEADLKIIFQA